MPVSGGGTERQVALIQDFGARVLCATPSYALNIAEVAAGLALICGIPAPRRRYSAQNPGAMRSDASLRIA